MQFSKIAYLSPMRSWLRRLGFMKLASLIGEMRTRWRYFQYQWKRPQRVPVQIGPWTARMYVADAIEYARVLSVREDRHILQFLLKWVRRGDVCWDVGANIGLYTLLLARAVGENGTVVAFEPEKRALDRLIQNAALNNFENIKVLRLALGRENTKMELRIAEHYSSGTHRLIKETEGFPPGSTNVVLVDVIKGDDIRRGENLEVPSIIKIDVEGMEEDVLSGLNETLRHPQCRCIVCEVHFSILEARGLREVPLRIEPYLREHGFNHAVWLDHSHLGVCKV